MKKLRAWITVGSFAFLGSATAVSCGGDDEATGDGNRGGGGTLDGGGSGGTEGGVVRDADSAATVGNVGMDCITDDQCGDGLTCVARTDTDTLGGAPPNGMCTAPCESDDECLEFSSNAWCFPFETGNFCVEGCNTDDSGFETKCHDRLDFACSPQINEVVGGACESNDECQLNEVCYEGACNVFLSVCLPMCGSDADCGDLFCDFLTGFCVEEQPEGKGFGEACDPDAANGDGCLGGFCFESYEDPTQGTCSGICNALSPYSCGFGGEGVADNACLYSTIFAGQVVELGDWGLCSQLCDCNDECNAPGDVCLPWEEGEAAEALEGLWGRKGYCWPLVDGGTLTEADSLGACEGVGGGGGAGGAGGTPGQGGEAGTPDQGGAGGSTASGGEGGG